MKALRTVCFTISLKHAPLQDGEVVTAGLNGLSAMCGLSSGRARVGQEGGVVGVVSCAGREEGGVRDASAQCLAHISTDSPANCKSVLDTEH